MSKEIEVIEKSSLDRFNFLKDQSSKISKILETIEVKDDTSEAIAVQKLSEAKAFVGEIESLRVIVKKPYLDTGKKIDEAAKLLAAPVESRYKTLSDSVLVYKQEKAKAERERLAKAQEVRNKLIRYQSESIVEINKASTMKELSDVYKVRVLSFPLAEEWGEFAKDAEEMKAIIIKHGKLRKAQIEELANAPVEKIEEIKTKQETESAEHLVEDITAKTNNVDTVIATVAATKTTGVRKDWAFEVINPDLIPREFLIPNEAKIREFMRNQVTTNVFESGKSYEINGIKFEQKETLTIRK